MVAAAGVEAAMADAAEDVEGVAAEADIPAQTMPLLAEIDAGSRCHIPA